MTAIFYRDCQANSRDGKFTLEARSPHNGSINHRNGKPSSEDEFPVKYRQHQSEFRYRLLDNTTGSVFRRLPSQDRCHVVWERWQGKEEDSPCELVVSEDGWSILRTHGFRPEVIAVSPSGKDILCVRIGGDGPEHRSSWPGDSLFSWSPLQLSFTTAGIFWTGNSWRSFLQFQGRPYFVWRTYWGQRLVIDLERAVLVSESDQADPLLALALSEHEKQGVYDLLAELSLHMTEIHSFLEKLRSPEQQEEREPHPLEEQIRSAKSALHLAGVHHITGCIPFLREWEEFDCPGSGMGSAMGNWWLEVQCYRPIVQHSLRLLGQEPAGFPGYHFQDNNQRLPVPERVIDRQQRAHQLNRQMSAEQVLELLGSPDHIRCTSYKEGNLYRWSEDWEYDFRRNAEWTTLRITWMVEKRKGLITDIKEVPPYWLLSDERECEILQW